MSVETDANGRLYLSSEMREKYGERFHIVEYEDRIELIPIDDDPLEAVREAAGDAFDDKSVETLRREAREQAAEDATAGFERERDESSEGES
ncbi:AbrB/MazE/SpoVT family DNA-binding domain-containing protein [Halosegnis longus]|uniref:AbrB/MazE/SpoVT family DNA-binding domain-containing protein n=1 Tax=Halosegnis longus TaxID=2216012 RepID=A0AAJ4R8L8_9EURY|nr:AbrB/MazE/SpoVT family DNA-binding domain-containing protein [Halosegnis longus]RNJ26232.1 AbrB/MazE/SpoVT family DNA-binding domain-containing protein [Salella cibi]